MPVLAASISLINGGFIPTKKGTIERDSRSGKDTGSPKTLPCPFRLQGEKRAPRMRVFPLYPPVQEGIAKGVQFPERFLRIHHQSIPRDDALHLAAHHRNEGVSGRLRPNPHAREILFQEIPGGSDNSHNAGMLWADQHRPPTARQMLG